MAWPLWLEWSRAPRMSFCPIPFPFLPAKGIFPVCTQYSFADECGPGGNTGLHRRTGS